MAFKRTAQCKKCGEVLLKIESGIGEVTYSCKACNSKVATVTYDEYQTLLPTCEQCGGDTFKAKIIEDDFKEYLDAECVSCKKPPKTVYMDNYGYIINEDKRMQIIKQDELNRLREENEYKVDLIQILEKKIENLNGDLEEKDTYLYILEKTLKDNEYELSNFERNIRGKEEYISDLEYKVADLEEKLRNLIK
ncbi:MAG: hypothetical protein RR262_05800 [Clostridium sp.]